ncbi:MAG TPA: M28 family peptidase [Chthonomonadales bacterium]|nr:M28 family peptidase [Chthonomonadales bacterium]
MIRSSRYVAAVLAAAVLACPTLAASRRAGEAISAGAFQSHVAFLASERCEGRMSGERGNEIAARYIADVFRRAGLKPVGTRRQRDAAAMPDGTGYFQPFTFDWGVRRGPGNRMDATVSGRTEALRPGTDFDPVSASSSGAAAGEVVFAGYGLRLPDGSRDDYGAADVTGKVVLVLDGAPTDSAAISPQQSSLQRKAQIARDEGAGALVVVLPGARDRPALNTTERAQPSGIPIVRVTRRVADRWLRASGRSLRDMALAASAPAEPVATGVHVSLTTDLQPLPRTTANVVGLLRGSDPVLRDEVVVVGAHMDHLGRGVVGSVARSTEIHPGADDNASGTAGVMAMAERLASLAEQPKRSVLFIAFSGHETGLFGSQHYVHNPIVPIERTVAMLNFDMIGRVRQNRIIVVGTGTSPAWPALIDEANRSVGLTVVASPRAGGGSDHAPFAARQIPVLFFISGMHPDYHRPSDTADKVNALDAARVVTLASGIVEQVSSGRARIGWTQSAGSGSRRDELTRARSRVQTGIVPDYGALTVARAAPARP